MNSFVIWALCSSMVFSGKVFAQTTQTLTQDQSVTPVVKTENRFSVIYWGMLTGPSLGNPSFYQSDANTGTLDPTSPDNWYHQFKVDYALDSKWTVGLVINSLAQSDKTHPYLMRESGFRIGNKSIIKYGTFNWSGDLRILLPTASRAHEGGVESMIETMQTLAADVGKWNLGLSQFYIFRAFGDNGGGKKLDLYVSPFAIYNFNDVTSAVFAVELYPIFYSGNTSLKGWNSAPMDISAGPAFNITPLINVNPVLIAYPDHLNMNTTAFAAYFSAKLI